MKPLAPLIEAFFTERLQTQIKASPNTILTYRDTFRLLLLFLTPMIKKSPSQLNLEDLTASKIQSFITYLEQKRKNSPRTCNVRLAAIHSFFKYLEYKEPAYLGQIKQVLMIPQKRYTKKLVSYLHDSEIEALLKTPDQNTSIGRRDYLIIALMIQTGLRVSELTQLKWEQITLTQTPHIRCVGKGRKERYIPLTKAILKALTQWKKESPHPDYVFISIRKGRMSRDAIEKIIKKYRSTAAAKCSTLKTKNITPHSLRHTTAIQLLLAKVDISMIALYLGHESIETTQIYLKADLKTQEEALKGLQKDKTKFKRYKADDRILNYLAQLGGPDYAES